LLGFGINSVEHFTTLRVSHVGQNKDIFMLNLQSNLEEPFVD